MNLFRKITILQLFLTIAGLSVSFCDDFPQKKYREFHAQFSYRDGKIINSTTKLLPEDENDLSVLENIEQQQRATGGQDFRKVIDILKRTDSSAVVEKALIALCRFRDLPRETVFELHSLANCENWNIKSPLAYTLGWFGHVESLPILFKLAGDENEIVSGSAITMLRYFGIEAMAAFPFIRKRGPIGYDSLFLAKALRHICFLVFVPAGIQMLPSYKRVRVPSNFFPGATGNFEGYLEHRKIEELIFPK